MQELVDALSSGALESLTKFEQFVLCKLVKKENGKINKIPVCPRTGTYIDCTNPDNWLSASAVVSAAGEADDGHGIGFVFTANDPFVFIDVDNCIDENGELSDIAQEIKEQFPNAAFEISTSGRGIHLFCRAWPSFHTNKNTSLGLEFYSKNRFVALTGSGISGDASFDYDDEIEKFIVACGFACGDSSVSGELSERWDAQVAKGRDKKCSAPEDDDRLLNIAFGAKSKSGRCTFQQLYEYSTEVDEIYSSSRSEADAALSMHLAFWTGNDCERMKKLMLESALYRDKFARRGYLETTILSACVKTNKCYQRKPPATSDNNSSTGTDTVSITSKGRTLTTKMQREYFAGCVYIFSGNLVYTPARGILEQSGFNIEYGGCDFFMNSQGQEKPRRTRKPWVAFTESLVNQCPRVDAQCFRPDLPPGEIVHDEGHSFVNTYKPADIQSVQGDVTLFTRHIDKLLPAGNDAEILLSYLAACVQHPGVKFQWAPVIQGVEGNGKSLISLVAMRAIGKEYYHAPNAKDLDNKFNSWMFRRILAGVEDIKISASRQDILETLKPMITQRHIEIQGKTKDQMTLEVCCNFIFNSNHKDAIRKTKNDRRFAIFYTAQQEVEDLADAGMGVLYFRALNDWLDAGGYAAVTHYLQNYAIKDSLNPAVLCLRAPKTTSTASAIDESLGLVEQEIVDAVAEGRNGFRGGWISSTQLQQLLDELNLRSRISPQRTTQILKELGYVIHPALKKFNGRVTSVSRVDNNKPRLYIKEDHISQNITLPRDVAAGYDRAQTFDNEDVSEYRGRRA